VKILCEITKRDGIKEFRPVLGLEITKCDKPDFYP
jgi:hypothetical protein